MTTTTTTDTPLDAFASPSFWRDLAGDSSPLGEAVRAGLMRWSRAVLFAAPPVELVVEITDVGIGPDGRPNVIDGNSRGPLIKHEEEVRIGTGGYRAAPRSHGGLLLPTRSNVVRVERGRGSEAGAVVLVLELAGDTALRTAAADAEVDLYLAAGDDGTSDETFEAFATLVAAAWPERVALPAGSVAVFPRPGLRGVTAPRPSALRCVRAADLLEAIGSAFALRFLRLPASGLLPFLTTTATGCVVRIPVQVGADAARLQALLDGRLRLNHVVYWDWLRGDVTRPLNEGEDLPLVVVDVPSSARPVLIGCTDVDTGREYVDRTFAEHVDPKQIVDLVETRTGSYALRFQRRGSTRLTHAEFLLQHASANVAAVEPGEVGSMKGDRRCVVRAVSRGIPPHAEGSALARVCVGEGRLLHARAVTRDEVARLVWELMPPPLRRALRMRADGRPPRLVMATVVKRPDPPHALPTALEGYAIPVTVVLLPCQPTADRAALLPDARRLARRVQERCAANIVIDIELTGAGGDA